MNKDDLDLLADTLSRQTADDERVRPIPRRRLAALAHNPAGMTPQEVAALLLAPSVRAAFLALQNMSGVPANDDDYVFRSTHFAAADGARGPFSVEAPFGTLSIRPGPDDVVPFVLMLRLRPTVPGGIAARQVTVWELRTNQVWLDGMTNDNGVLLGTWPLVDAAPHDRLQVDELCFALAEHPVR